MSVAGKSDVGAMIREHGCLLRRSEKACVVKKPAKIVSRYHHDL
jgi:hypothetical protein